MPWSEFEEKEYEAPLYNQMEAGNSNVWSPGQVFEHKIAIDHGMFVTDPHFWQHIGFRAVRRGSVLSRYNFAFLPRPLNRSLPDFKMNVFIQAKRCQRLQRVGLNIQESGISSPCYKFSLDVEQRDVLYAVADSLGYHSYVCYAAPAFHTLSQLYRYTRHGSIVDNSTFPSAASLAEHDSWYYNKPGAYGVANSEPEYIEHLSLNQQIKEMLEHQPDTRGSTSENLKELASLIIKAIDESSDMDGPRRSAFFDELRLIDREVENYDVLRTDLRNFLYIAQFSLTFNVQWYTLG